MDSEEKKDYKGESDNLQLLFISTDCKYVLGGQNTK